MHLHSVGGFGNRPA